MKVYTPRIHSKGRSLTMQESNSQRDIGSVDIRKDLLSNGVLNHYGMPPAVQYLAQQSISASAAQQQLASMPGCYTSLFLIDNASKSDLTAGTRSQVCSGTVDFCAFFENKKTPFK